MANSPKYHELCGAIISECHLNIQGSNKLDKILRSYLEACAEKLAEKLFGAGKDCWISDIRPILGLGDVEAKKCLSGDTDCVYTCCNPRKGHCSAHDFNQRNCIACNPTPKEGWCEHMGLKKHEIEVWSDINYKEQLIMFCPICGTPRPEVKSLEERLRLELRRHWDNCDKFCLDGPCLSRHIIEFLKENK